MLHKINTLVNDLNNDNKKYKIGKDAIAKIKLSIEDKETKHLNSDEDKANLKIVLDGMERLKLNYATKYEIFNRDTKEFVEYLSTLKKTESLLIQTEAKQAVENTVLSKITENLQSF
jgi:predicted Co/Zn/Cd cation transporter (cation efflux family)